MSQTLEIPRERWGDYLDALSHRELKHRVRIRVEGEELGDQPMVESLPLLGISCDRKGSCCEAIEVSVGNGQHHITHLIGAPAHIYVEEHEGGAIRVMNIEDRARIKTVIFFEA